MATFVALFKVVKRRTESRESMKGEHGTTLRRGVEGMAERKGKDFNSEMPDLCVADKCLISVIFHIKI